MSVPLHRIYKKLAVKKVHVAMFAAFAHLVATMPGIPDYHFITSI